jgi:hypothetical protein
MKIWRIPDQNGNAKSPGLASKLFISLELSGLWNPEANFGNENAICISAPFPFGICWPSASEEVQRLVVTVPINPKVGLLGLRSKTAVSADPPVARGFGA